MNDFLALFERDTALRRVATTNGGEWCGPCPFCGGRDRFRVWPNHPGGRGRWWCRQCGRSGDAIAYLREHNGLSYREALEWLGGQLPATRPAAKRAPAVCQDIDRPTWDPSAALAVVVECEAALWHSTGEKARGWLHRRGLRDDTLRTWHIGYNPADRVLCKLYVPRGIVIPCTVDGEVWYLKVRRPVPPLPGAKYQQVPGGKSALFGLDHLAGRHAVVFCEAELDAILLHQEAGDLVDVVALGSKSARPALPWLVRLLAASHWLVALDNDADDAAQWWSDFSARVRRVRPLQGNDVTEFHQAGGDLRAWINFHLAALSSLPAAVAVDPPVRMAVEELGAVVVGADVTVF